MAPPPIDASEFEAHKDLSRIIVEFLCRKRDKAFSVKEIAKFTGIREEDINYIMLKLSFQDVIGSLSDIIVHRKAGTLRSIRIEDVTIDGTVYYRCVKLHAEKP
jgi:DNA-directed RNA polymerase specialized sigma subunit